MYVCVTERSVCVCRCVCARVCVCVCTLRQGLSVTRRAHRHEWPHWPAPTVRAGAAGELSHPALCWAWALSHTCLHTLLLSVPWPCEGGSRQPTHAGLGESLCTPGLGLCPSSCGFSAAGGQAYAQARLGTPLPSDAQSVPNLSLHRKGQRRALAVTSLGQSRASSSGLLCCEERP